MKTTTLLARLAGATGLAVAVTASAMLSLPTESTSFTTIGGSLGLSQRDFRVWNNFGNAGANNNNNPHPNFPGALGAEMSIWKGHVEWASGPYAGNGLGDGVGSNPVLGNGGANYDNTYQGETFSSGGTNDNVHSEGGSCGGGTLAFTETPISNGWRIIYCAEWSWQDGPGNISGTDLQGVACHEIGHALGLGHTNASPATMTAFISGNGVSDRSIEADDIAGVQFIYGVKSGNKPEITSLSGSKNVGEVLTINGNGFSNGGNEVWFTKISSNGVPVKVTNVSSSGGGSVINVTIPAGVQDGEVLVQRNATGNSALSNAFPIDVGSGNLNPPFLAQISPTAGVAGGFEEVTLTGAAFTGTTSVDFGANEALGFTVDSDTQITVTTPASTTGTGTVDVTVTTPDGTSTLPNAYSYSPNLPPEITAVTPNTGSELGGQTVSITGPSLVGAGTIQFGGVAASNVQVVSETEATCTTPPGTGTVDVKVTVDDGLLFFDTDTLPNGFTYEAPGNTGAFVQYGAGAGGVGGVPDWDGSGDLTPGSGSFTLTLSNGLPFTPATLYVGAAEASVPFKQQTLLTFPILLQLPLGNVGVDGTISLPASIPAGTPTASIYSQVFLVDGSGPAGLTSTNGLRLDIP